jgi:hypothetical protein
MSGFEGFGEWLKINISEADSIGYLAKWFFDDSGLKWRRGRKVKKEDVVKSYLAVIEKKAAMRDVAPLIAALQTAVHEWQRHKADSDVIASEEKHLPGEVLSTDHRNVDHGDLNEIVLNSESEFVKVRSVVGYLDRTVKTRIEKGSRTSEEFIETLRLNGDVPLSSASVSLKYTKNLGNWESVTANYSLSIPCYLEEIEEAFSFAEDIASDRLQKAIAQLAGEDIGTFGGRDEEKEKEKEIEETLKEDPEDSEEGLVEPESDIPSDLTFESSFDPENDDVGI